MYIKQISPSPTLSLDAKVKKLQAEGVNIVNLTIGEPDFPTPAIIQKAAVRAMRDGQTHYTLTAGILPLRQAICNKLMRENKISYTPAQIVVGVGSKQLLYHAFQVLCQPGDEVLIATPTWNTYVEQVKLTGGKPVLIPLLPPFKLTASDLKQYLSKRTKIILLNSPANPTGVIIDKNELIAIAQIAVEKNLWVISDEIYEKIVNKTKPVSIASINLKIKEKTITINGFSKAYAMTGWRIGYAAGPEDIIKTMVNYQSQTTSNTNSIAQWAAITALEKGEKDVKKMVSIFNKRQALVIKELSKIKGIDFTIPEGAFYVYVSIKKLLNNQFPNSNCWCEKLLEEGKVAVVPGEAFFYPGYFRLSFAASQESLTVAFKKINNFINKYA